MGCGGGCGGGHDPYASFRNKGRRMARGTSVGVTKSPERLAREAQQLEAPKRVNARAEAIKKIAERNKELSDVPPSGIIKSKERLLKEQIQAETLADEKTAE